MTADSPHVSLAEFPRDHRAPGPALSSRVTAGALTAALAGLLVLFATHRTWWAGTQKPGRAEVVTQLVREKPREKVTPPIPLLAQLIRPRAEQPAAPVFTVAPSTPPAPALLAATAAPTSPMAGGSPNGTGMGAGGGSGTGGNGNGKGSGASVCWDPAWARAVTARVRRYFYFPSEARDRDITGVVVVRMTVQRNGNLEALEIGKSSGHALLDAAALDIMKRSNPLPRIPDRMHVDKVSAMFPLYFGAVDTSTDSPGNCKA